MKVWYSSSSCSAPCIICGKKTATWKVYEQCSMELRVPACDNDEADSCYRKFDEKRIASRLMTDLKQAIQKGADS